MSHELFTFFTKHEQATQPRTEQTRCYVYKNIKFSLGLQCTKEGSRSFSKHSRHINITICESHSQVFYSKYRAYLCGSVLLNIIHTRLFNLNLRLHTPVSINCFKGTTPPSLSEFLRFESAWTIFTQRHMIPSIPFNS